MTIEAKQNSPAGVTPPDDMPVGFICPKCLATKFGTVRLMPVHIIKCHGLSSDGPPFGCGWQGTWEAVRMAWHRRDAVREFAAKLIKQLLIIHRKKRAASRGMRDDPVNAFSESIKAAEWRIAASEVHAFSRAVFGIDIDYYKILDEVMKKLQTQPQDAEAADHSVDATEKVEPPKAAKSIESLRLYFCQDLPQFAEQCGIKPSDWVRIESGEIPITIDSTIERALAGLAKVAEQWRIERGDFGPEGAPTSEQIEFIVEGYWPHADGSQRWMKSNRPFGSYAAAEEWAQNALRAGTWRITPELDREQPASEPAAASAAAGYCDN